jgi:type II secretory pathway pseudopilin PulG
MLEMVVVIGVILVALSMALIQFQPSIQQFRANAARDQIQGALRQARELAISQRRYVQVQFNVSPPCPPAAQVPACIALTRLGGPADPTVLYALPVESSVQFMTFAGMPDTPDGFGVPPGGGIIFGGVVGGPNTMMYQSDGTFVNGAGTTLNGTVFMGVPGIVSTARAVSVLGTTGRVRSYNGVGSAWVTQ